MTETVLIANDADATLSTFRLTPDGLERLAVTELGGRCSTFAVDAARGLVFASVGGDRPRISTLAIEPAGSLAPVWEVPVDGPLAYLSLTADASVLLGASYHRGFATSWTVGDGVLTPGPTRLDDPNAHSIVPSADGRFAYLASLGADLIVVCALGADGALTVLQEVAAPAGSGPRHLILNAAQDSLYLLTEFGADVLHYRRAGDGLLTPAGRASAVDPGRGLKHSRFGADPRAEHLIWGADLRLSADEQFLWATERTESTVATLPIGADGRPGEAISFVVVEQQPRGIWVAGDGRLLVTGERSEDVSVCAAGPDGVLRVQDRTRTGRGANWVRSF